MISILNNQDVSIEKKDFELVERKGVGHPDTICDSIAEKASEYYSKYCLDNFGGIAHHWFDKVMLIGGEANIQFGFGEITKPYEIIFAGKAAYRYATNRIPVAEILKQASIDVLSKVLTGFIPDKHLKVNVKVVDSKGPGRKETRYRPMKENDLIKIGDENLVSNDCNLLHGYAPLSRLEKLVLFTEQFVNGEEFKQKNSDTGWDVKVFGIRNKDFFRIIVNIPFLAQQIKSMEHYKQRKNEVMKELHDFIYRKLELKPEIIVNSADRGKRAYLTVLGSVADTGDVGVVGRGNRLNGLITPMRSMSIEAAAGKNPLDHTGKLYGILTDRLAKKLFAETGNPVDVHIMTTKEAHLKDPDHIIVKISKLDDDEKIKEKVKKIVFSELNSVYKITDELINKGIVMW
ncbi:methionine adenosyltransferase [Oceanobacillus sp. CFH 90083]|uniref:methionine adenosyltransferase n=1 Tax=Oceanobacillus sp. CFH 90083 TaxID=2592336 RepID=UPI00128DDCA2|nr:methionine adenosyltransferase [Oceanobacillus sp. CFH 90083]